MLLLFPASNYGPTFDVASVKLMSQISEVSVTEEGQCAPVERCALARRGLANEGNQRISWHGMRGMRPGRWVSKNERVWCTRLSRDVVAEFAQENAYR